MFLCREANVTETAITVLGQVAMHVQWQQYKQILSHFLRHMTSQSTSSEPSKVSDICTA